MAAKYDRSDNPDYDVECVRLQEAHGPFIGKDLLGFFFLGNSAVLHEGRKIMKNDDGRSGASARGIRKTPQSRGNHNLPTTLLLIVSAQYKRARTIGRFIIKSDRGQIGTMHSLPSSAA